MLIEDDMREAYYSYSKISTNEEHQSMNDSIRMNVSSMTRHQDNKAIYVLFTDEDKTAEFTLPGCNLISNKGFNMQEIAQLKEYVDNEQDKIFSMAKTVNPARAFIGQE